jgi:predicted amidohydrolase
MFRGVSREYRNETASDALQATNMTNLTVAAIQMDCQVGDVKANLAHAAELVEQAAAQRAQLVVLPELFNTGYEYTDHNFTLPEPLDGPTGTWIVETARRLNVHLLGIFPARVGSKAYIAAKLAAPDGRTWAYYKNHVALWENLYFERGSQPLIADTELGRIGLLICWDQVFADLARAYQGRVDLLCVPSSPPLWLGTLEDAQGNVLARLDAMRSLGRTLDGADWFDRARVAHARSASVPLIYAARCGEFHSPIPYGWSFLTMLKRGDAQRVRRAVGTDYLLRCPFQGRSCILDAAGEPLAQTDQAGEAVLVATVQRGTPDPATLPPVPRGRAMIPGVPKSQFLFDDSLIVQGWWVRWRRGQG